MRRKSGVKIKDEGERGGISNSKVSEIGWSTYLQMNNTTRSNVSVGQIECSPREIRQA